MQRPFMKIKISNGEPALIIKPELMKAIAPSKTCSLNL